MIDVDRYMRGPMLEPIRGDRTLFEEVSVDEELGVVVWPNGADIDPDVLYGLHQPTWTIQEAGREDPPCPALISVAATGDWTTMSAKTVCI